MPRIHTTLAYVQESLDGLSFDDLHLLRDFLKKQLGEKVVRYGLPAIEQSLRSANLDRLLEKIPSLSDADKRALLKVIEMLCRALEPQKGRRGGTGSIEIKRIKRGGREYGPFAYLRYWATGGDWNGTKRVIKSMYLGKEIALAIEGKTEAVAQGIKEQVLRAIESGTLEQLKDALRQHS